MAHCIQYCHGFFGNLGRSVFKKTLLPGRIQVSAYSCNKRHSYNGILSGNSNHHYADRSRSDGRKKFNSTLCVFSLQLCYLGYFLLCILKSVTQLAGIIIHLGHSIPGAGSLGRASNCTLHSFLVDDRSRICCRLFSGKRK